MTEMHAIIGGDEEGTARFGCVVMVAVVVASLNEDKT